MVSDGETIKTIITLKLEKKKKKPTPTQIVVLYCSYINVSMRSV